MKKEKLISLTNMDKTLWFTVSATSFSVEYINTILKKYSSIDGLEGCSCEDMEKFSTKYRCWNNRKFTFFTGDECGYIFFMKDRIEVILRKESKLFNKLKKEFLDYFEFKKSKIIKKPWEQMPKLH